MLKDTTPEIEQLQNELWMKRTPQERVRFQMELFTAARRVIIASMPKGLTEREFKRRLYFRTYGEELPVDFLKVKKMKCSKILILFFALLFVPHASHAQAAEVTISFNEHFMDAVIDAMFKAAPPPEFLIAASDFRNPMKKGEVRLFNEVTAMNTAKAAYTDAKSASSHPACRESVRLLAESAGVRTSVRFRDGKIIAPLAFEGSYNPPLVGCVDFSGWAESSVELVFEEQAQRLTARVRVLNVSLNGTGGVGGGLIAKMVQSSIDKKINPIEIMRLENISFLLPIQNSSKLKMKATGMRHEITDGRLDVHIAYQFEKG